MVLIFMILWFAFSFMIMKKKKERIYNPVVWLLFGWFFSFGLYCFSGIQYKYELSVKTGVYYWLIAVMVALGFRISQKKQLFFGKQNKMRWLSNVNYISQSSYRLYVGIVAFGTILLVFDILRLNVISLNLHTDLNISGIGNIGILLSSMGLVLWLYECVRAILNNQKFRLSAYMALFCYLVPAFLTSGRQSILIMGVSTVVVLFYSFSHTPKYRYKYSLIIPLLGACVALFSYVTIISSSRTVVSNKISLFNFMYASSLSKETTALLDKLGFLKTIVLETIYYYSHELSMLEVLMQYYDGPMFWGFAQMSLLARNIPAGKSGTISDVMWMYLNSMSEKAGVYNHVWRSAAGSCYLDYGFIGGLIFALIIGYALGRFYKKCRKQENNYNTVGIALMCSGMLFCMQFSPISEAYWIYPVFWWLILPVSEKLLKR